MRHQYLSKAGEGVPDSGGKRLQRVCVRLNLILSGDLGHIPDM